MSKSKKYGKSDPEDLMRYSADGLSDEERHALEREAQKDPFVEEALEGYSFLSAEEAGDDLSRLQSRLIRRISGRRSMVWVRIAASVAVIITVGTLYLTVFTDKLGKMDRTVAETESVEQAREKGVPEDLKTVDEVGTEEAGAPAQLDVGGRQQESDIPGIIDDDGEQEVAEDRIEAEEPVVEPVPSEAAGQIDIEGDMEYELHVAEEVIISDYDSQSEDMADVGVNVEITVASQTRQQDMAEATQQKSAVADEGVAMVSPRAMAKKESRAKSGADVSSVQMLPDSIPALPVVGMENFIRYIKENIRYPEGDSLPANANVVLTFDISNDGRPGKIEIEESPGDAFSMEAVRLLQEGPAWRLAFKDGRPVARRNRLKIEFYED